MIKNKKNINSTKPRPLDKITANLVHKMNNLRGVISGNAQYLLERLKKKDLGNLTEEDLKEIRECLRIIMEKCDDLGK